MNKGCRLSNRPKKSREDESWSLEDWGECRWSRRCDALDSVVLEVCARGDPVIEKGTGSEWVFRKCASNVKHQVESKGDYDASTSR